VLPAGGLSLIFTVQVGEDDGPQANSTRRGHCNVMSWPIMSLVYSMGDELVDCVSVHVVVR
jgi:hypothetical protein